ncbi:MAG: Ig-like domain-containing protein, partial [Chloroflexi bacterium]|nr:Ig-like domain-containing protein [Chloroflexota bacterium]
MRTLIQRLLLLLGSCLRLTASDTALSAFDEVTVQVALNQAPYFVSTPVTVAQAIPVLVPSPTAVTHTYAYDADALDPDGQALIYSLAEAPANLTLHPATGLMEWSPTTNQVGAAHVTVRVEDGFGGVALQPFVITVPPAVINQPPVVNAGPDRFVPNTTNTVTLAGSVSDDGLAGVPSLFFYNGNPPSELHPANPNTDTISDPNNLPLFASYQNTFAPLVLPGAVTDYGWPAGSAISQSWGQVSGPGAAFFSQSNALTNRVV